MVFVVLEIILHNPVPAAVVEHIYETVAFGIESPMAVVVTESF
jgi:hypothetical protein